MKKKGIVRCVIGAPIGLALSTIITIIISLTVGDGVFYPVVPELVADCGTEINAVVLQAAASLLYGAAWAGASLVWEMERWSLLRQTVTHAVIVSLATFPIAYAMRWMPHSAIGVCSYFGFFFVIYLVIWAFQYQSVKKRVQEMNQKMQGQK